MDLIKHVTVVFVRHLYCSSVKRLKEMEVEMSKLNRVHADLELENQALKELTEKNSKPSAKRDAVSYLARRCVVRFNEPGRGATRCPRPGSWGCARSLRVP